MRNIPINVQCLLLDDVVKYVLRYLKKNDIDVYDKVRIGHYRITLNLPQLTIDKKIGNIIEVMNCELRYFKTARSPVFNVRPDDCKKDEDIVKYCTYWFLRDVYCTVSIPSDGILLKFIEEMIANFKENGKL